MIRERFVFVKITRAFNQTSGPVEKDTLIRSIGDFESIYEYVYFFIQIKLINLLYVDIGTS